MNRHTVELIVKLAVAVTTSVAMPLVASYVWEGKIPGIDQVLLGMLLFLIITALQIGHDLSHLLRIRQEEYQLWDIRSKTDLRLANIRKHYFDILSQRNTLYDLYFRQQFTELERAISDAATRGLVNVHQNADTTRMMLEGFDGGKEDIVRAVHYCKDNSFMFSVHASHFFAEIYKCVQSHQLSGVRRLIVVEGDDDLEDHQTRLLVSFHKSNPKYDCKIISRADLQHLMRDFQLPRDTYDFGIYGTRFLYKGSANLPDDIRGIFSSDINEVTRFTSFFDRCWDSQASHAPPLEGEHVGLADLFGRSSVSPNRPGVEQTVLR